MLLHTCGTTNAAAPAVGMRPNPLALDPTRTTMLRRRYMAEMGKRFRALRGAVRQQVATDDAFGLRPANKSFGGLQSNQLTTNAGPWIFLTDAQKLVAFQAWFVQQVKMGVMAPAPGAAADTPWMTPYVDSAYMQGVQRAYTETHAEAMAEGLDDAIYEGGQEAFLASSFSGQVATNKIELLATRNFEQLKGVTAAMGQQVNRVLSDGLVAGHGPDKIAKAMTDTISGLTKSRAMTIARTEIIHAHAEGQLDSFEAMNVEEVGAMAEWATAGDGKVCPVCAPLEGAILTIKEARGLIPRHPNCRCMWLPADVGEDTTGQTWAKDIIDFDFLNSMKKETGKKGGKDARAGSKWAGAGKKISDKGHKKPTKKNKAAKAATLDAKAKAKAAKAAARLEISKAKAAEASAAAKAKAAEVAAAAAQAKADAAALHTQKLAAGEAKAKAKAAWGLGEDDFALDGNGVAAMTAAGKAKIAAAKAKAAHSDKVKQGMAKSHFTKKIGVDEDHIVEGKLTPPGKLTALKAKGFEGFGDPLLTQYVGKEKTPAEQAAYDAGQEFLGAKTLTAQKTAYDKIKHPLYKAVHSAAPANPTLAKNLADSHINHRATGKADFSSLEGWGGDGPKSYGGVMVDDRGRVLLREPKGHFDGYAWTFPKGGVDGDDNPLQTALKEVAEETGHKGRTVGYLPGAFEGGTSDVHMFIMKSDGEDASAMDAETKGLRWVTKDEAAKLIGQSKNKIGQERDLAILDAAYEQIDFMGSPDTTVKKSGTVGSAVQAHHFADAVGAGNKQAETAAKAAKAAGRATAASAVPGDTLAAFPADGGDLRYIKTLSGSTAPSLKEDLDGKQWVVKETGDKLSANHIRSELLADKLYADLGIAVPAGTMLETSTGPQKVTEFLEGGMTLQDWQKGKTKAEIKAMHKQVRQGFVADALLANHDVAGMTLDNLFIVDGKPIRIDNGGALLYRAQGDPKADFGPVVAELASMRDKKYVVAELYEGIGDDEINDQIRHIVHNRDKLLATVMAQAPSEDTLQAAGIIDARITYLEGLLPPDKPKRKAKAKATPEEAMQPIREINAAAVRRVRGSRANGVVVAGDKRDIEDNSVLVWEQKTGAGDPVTRVSLKMTDDGNAKVQAALGAAMAEADGVSTRASATTAKPPASNDTDKQLGAHSKITTAYKTAYTHAADGGYNEIAVAELATTKAHLQTLLDPATKVGDLLTMSPNGLVKVKSADKAMAAYYMEHVDTVEGLIKAGKKPTDMMRPFIAPVDKAKASDKAEAAVVGSKAVQPLSIRKQYVSRVPGTFDKGHAQEMTDPTYPANRLPGEEYVVDLGGGVQATYMPRKPGTRERSGLALEGTLELTMDGPVTVERMREINTVIKGLGVDPTPPTPEFTESVYIHRTLTQRMARDASLSITDRQPGWKAYGAIWDNTNVSEKQRVKRQKAWVSKYMDIDLPASGETAEWYNPAGQAMTSAGDGRQTWVSWLRTPEEVEKEMPKESYIVQHTVGGLSNSDRNVIPGLTRALLESGGELTSTTARLRKGVPLNKASGESIGQSSSDDIDSGGASYAFTRVREVRDGNHVQGFFFKVRNVRRADSTHYSSDVYGAIEKAAIRANTSLRDIEAHTDSGNELVLKNGISMIDEIDVIRVWTTKEKRETIKAFKDAKITVLPDGRKVKDIILVKGQPFDTADRNYEAYSFADKGTTSTVGQSPRKRDAAQAKAAADKAATAAFQAAAADDAEAADMEEDEAFENWQKQQAADKAAKADAKTKTKAEQEQDAAAKASAQAYATWKADKTKAAKDKAKAEIDADANAAEYAQDKADWDAGKRPHKDDGTINDYAFEQILAAQTKAAKAAKAAKGAKAAEAAADTAYPYSPVAQANASKAAKDRTKIADDQAAFYAATAAGMIETKPAAPPKTKAEQEQDAAAKASAQAYATWKADKTKEFEKAGEAADKADEAADAAHTAAAHAADAAMTKANAAANDKWQASIKTANATAAQAKSKIADDTHGAASAAWQAAKTKEVDVFEAAAALDLPSGPGTTTYEVKAQAKAATTKALIEMNKAEWAANDAAEAAEEKAEIAAEDPYTKARAKTAKAKAAKAAKALKDNATKYLTPLPKTAAAEAAADEEADIEFAKAAKAAKALKAKIAAEEDDDDDDDDFADFDDDDFQGSE